MAFDWGNAFRQGTQYGAIPGAIAGFFGNDDEDTDKWLDKIPDELKKYLEPYINAGQGALGQANSEYDKLLSDPNALIAKIGSGYKESPGYQWRLGQGENAITNAAAMNGMAGTAQHQQQAGELAGHLADQDFNDFMERSLGVYNKGLEGKKGIATLGANASGDLATSLANYLHERAGLNYQRGLNKNQQNSDMFSNIFSSIGSMFGV